MPNETDRDRATLASRLKEAREYVGLSQEEVAAILTVPRSAISLMESGERKVDAIELKRLAKLFQQPLEFFTGSVQTSTLPPEVAHLARTASKMTPKDRDELIRFAQFLQARNSTKAK